MYRLFSPEKSPTPSIEKTIYKRIPQLQTLPTGQPMVYVPKLNVRQHHIRSDKTIFDILKTICPNCSKDEIDGYIGDLDHFRLSEKEHIVSLIKQLHTLYGTNPPQSVQHLVEHLVTETACFTGQRNIGTGRA